MISSEQLERLKVRAEASIDSLGKWMISFTAVVVIGLAIEYNHSFVLFVRTYDWNILRESLGGLLVTVGVAGELFIEFRAHRRETLLRNINAEIEHEAEERLKAADERIADAQRHANEANERAANAELRAAEATKGAAEANRIAEAERLERVKLQERFAWRILSLEQQTRIIESIKAYTGTKFDLFITPTPESVQLLDSIESVLKCAGWVELPPYTPGAISFGDRASLAIPTARSVLQLAQSRTQTLFPAAVALLRALNAEGLAFELYHATPDGSTGPNDDGIHVIIGARPMA